jgi:hypothetical protein
MKDQYFGDVNDYRKYGLLRTLTARQSLKLGVAWMLTPPDGRADGSHVAYLNEPERFRACDPPLFDALRNSLQRRCVRCVSEVRRARLLPGAIFDDTIVPDAASAREALFKRLLRRFRAADLIFFDPDNGLEVKSRSWGRPGSAKYLFWREAEAAFGQGHSLLIYQHFPRVERAGYSARLAAELRARTGAARIFRFHTSGVLFLLASQPRHADLLERGAARMKSVWCGQVQVG